MNGLLELAARCEAAAGADRELDAAIAVAALGFFEIEPKWEGGPVGYGYIDADGCPVHPGHGGDQLVKEFTASLDAAMELAKDFGGQVTFFKDGTAKAFLWQPYPMAVEAKAATPALALTAAALKARALAAQGAEG